MFPNCREAVVPPDSREGRLDELTRMRATMDNERMRAEALLGESDEVSGKGWSREGQSVIRCYCGMLGSNSLLWLMSLSKRDCLLGSPGVCVCACVCV